MSRRLATTVLMQVCAAITVAAGISGLCASPPACLAVQSAGSGIGAEVAQVRTRSGGLPCPPLFIPLRGGGVAAAGAGAGEDSSSTGALEGAQEPVVPWDALLRDLKTEKPLDKAAEFEKARDALFHGNLSALESLRQDWQNRTFRGEKVSREEAQFWRLERYAQRWPPPWLPEMRNQSNPVVFLDVAIRALDSKGSLEHEGRITIELFADRVPRTADNFRAFCTGEVLDPRNFLPAGYKNTLFHRIVAGFLVQGGDFVKYDGTGCYSIYGGMSFADEDLSLPHTYGSVAMANAGPDTNGCQLFIVTSEDASFLDGKHLALGHIQ